MKLLPLLAIPVIVLLIYPWTCQQLVNGQEEVTDNGQQQAGVLQQQSGASATAHITINRKTWYGYKEVEASNKLFYLDLVELPVKIKGQDMTGYSLLSHNFMLSLITVSLAMYGLKDVV